MPVYVPRTKDARMKMQPVAKTPIVGVLLACGHQVDVVPGLSNPERWWCCNAWQPKKRPR